MTIPWILIDNWNTVTYLHKLWLRFLECISMKMKEVCCYSLLNGMICQSSHFSTYFIASSIPHPCLHMYYLFHVNEGTYKYTYCLKYIPPLKLEGRFVVCIMKWTIKSCRTLSVIQYTYKLKWPLVKVGQGD